MMRREDNIDPVPENDNDIYADDRCVFHIPYAIVVECPFCSYSYT